MWSRSLTFYWCTTKRPWIILSGPGLVFALVVLLPLSRWAGDGWLRTAAALIASSAVYPIAWWIAASSTGRSGSIHGWCLRILRVLGLIGVGERVLVRTARLGEGCLCDRSSWHCHWWVDGRGSACRDGSAILGSLGLGVFMVVWQTVVGASLGRGVPARPNKPLHRMAAPRRLLEIREPRRGRHR